MFDLEKILEDCLARKIVQYTHTGYYDAKDEDKFKAKFRSGCNRDMILGMIESQVLENLERMP